MKNIDVKNLLKKENIPQWRLAKAMSIGENKLSQMMRNELSEDVKEEILKLIKVIRKEELSMNKDIKNAMKTAGVKQWEVAQAISIGETTFCRKMRNTIPEKEKIIILEAIEKLKESKVQD